MSQENTEENLTENENIPDQEEVMNNASIENNSDQIDSLPIESIGSYARLEELVTEEEAGDTSNPVAQS
jgi:hypothetical protein